MDFSFSDDQAALQQLLSAYFAKSYPFSQSLADRTLALPRLSALWPALAQELGVLGASLPAELGGLGGGPVETMLIAEALGQALAVVPYHSSIVAGCGALSRVGTPIAGELIAKSVEGEVILAPALFETGSRYNFAAPATRLTKDGSIFRLRGRKILVHDAPFATHLVVTARDTATDALTLLLVDAAAGSVQMQSYRTMDGQAAGDIVFDGVQISADAILAQGTNAETILARMLDEWRAALGAELLGCLRAALSLTIAYARERRQFGVPIGSFQVLQHRMVDAYMHIERAASMVHMAALKLASQAPDVPVSVAAMMVKILQACRFVVPAAVQIHGGMGISDETPVTHYVRRITALERRLGSLEDNVARFDQLAEVA